MKLLAYISTGTIGTAIGYVLKTLLDHFAARRRLINQSKLDREKAIELDQYEREQYKCERFWVPLSRSLDRFFNRIRIVQDPDSAPYDWDSQYVQCSFLYELACLCYWLERPSKDPKLSTAIDKNDEIRIRDAILSITGLPLYHQKDVANKMECQQSGLYLSFSQFLDQTNNIIPEKISTAHDEGYFEGDVWYFFIKSELSRERYQELKLAINALLYYSLKFERYAINYSPRY